MKRPAPATEHIAAAELTVRRRRLRNSARVGVALERHGSIAEFFPVGAKSALTENPAIARVGSVGSRAAIDIKMLRVDPVIAAVAHCCPITHAAKLALLVARAAIQQCSHGVARSER